MGLTYFGHPVACRAALGNIATIEGEGLLKHADKMGDCFQSTLRNLSGLTHVADVSGHGLMRAIELMEDVAAKRAFGVSAKVGHHVFEACVQEGLIVRPVGDRIVLSPPLIIDEGQINRMAEILDVALEALAGRVPA